MIKKMGRPLPMFYITRKRDGLLVTNMTTGHGDYLSFFEGIVYRLTNGRLPNRFFVWHYRKETP